MKREMERPSISAAFGIKRLASTNDISQPSRATDHVTAVLRAELADLTAGEKLERRPSTKRIRPFGAFGSAAALESHIAEWRKNQILSPAKILDITIPVGTRIVGPPSRSQLGSRSRLTTRADGWDNDCFRRGRVFG
jgi:hypothetical protein